MKKIISRRSFLKRTIGLFLSTFGVGVSGYYYAREIEPKLLDINYHNIYHKLIPQGFTGFKIVQFSDTHLGFQYDLNQLNSLVKRINQLKPDIVFFTGDLIDEPNKYSRAKQIVPILKELHAPFGKFTVYGNHDHGGYGSDIYKSIMGQANFTVLLNENRELNLLDGSSIYVIGIDDPMLGRPDINMSIDRIPSDSYKILLSHAPDLADEAASFDIHLQLSGHSHGGQIKIPFVGTLVKPPYAEKYHEGFYNIGDYSSLTLYVNRGIGTTRMPFRFLSWPELTLFTLISQEAASSIKE